MWPCPKCREKIDDDFEMCWNCGTTIDGVEDPQFRRADDAPPLEKSTAIREETPAPLTKATRLPLVCPRCNFALKHVGTKSFHEGTSWGGFFGDLGEFFVNKESFDVYVCERCGRVEFFVTGIGEAFRQREDDE